MTTIRQSTRRLAGTEVLPIGLGAMPMALSGRPPEEQSMRTIHAALDAGVNLIDTADAYGRDESEVGHNERLIAKALQGRYDEVIVATKAGHTRPGGAWELDGRPEHIRAACEASLKALGTDRIDLYQYHRPDPTVPYAETVGAFKELQDEGKVRWIGLSNCNLEQLEAALGVAEIVSVQNQLSLAFTSPLAKGEVDACTQRGIAFLPWSPLGGIGNADGTGEVGPARAAADEHGVSPQQVALAWLLSLGPTVIPIPGASRPESIVDSARAAELELTQEQLDAITGAVTG
jgi:aryl-alcohol dehydrogenase-like predicted oxidoreductase